VVSLNCAQWRRSLVILLLVVLLAVTGLAGCASTPSAPPGTFSVYLGEPQRPLVPGNTTETEGGKVIEALWTPLVTFDERSRTVTYDGAAESVTSTDNRQWTIKIKAGWTFHDGTPVTAESYVRAWNYTALSSNAQGASYFFSGVQGYDALQGSDGKEPTATRMAGLRAPDPTTIEVTLSEAFAIFPITLGYYGFNPLPEAFYADPVAFGKKPIGNGPFKADTEWVPGRGITLSRYDNYAGKDKAKSRGVVMRVYTELSTAYTDVLAGNLDVLHGLPPDIARIVGRQRIRSPECSTSERNRPNTSRKLNRMDCGHYRGSPTEFACAQGRGRRN
jgi:oligopeptide transport system substrate-binding protein